MKKDCFYPMPPMYGAVFSGLDETEQKDTELAESRRIAHKLYEQVSELQQQITNLRLENYLLQLFIENEVPEEKRKLIFK